MSTQADQLGERVIVAGQAYVRMIEAADVLLSQNPAWTERGLMRLCHSFLTIPLSCITLEIATYPPGFLCPCKEAPAAC